MISAILFIISSGIKNLGAKKVFTFASICTVMSCSFLFSLFFIIASNVHSLVAQMETTIGIQVFFDEGLSEEEISMVASNFINSEYVDRYEYTSSEAAWENAKKQYFGTHIELAEAFMDDNPLANSSSYEIFLKNISYQPEFIKLVELTKGVRQINYSSNAIQILRDVDNAVSYVSFALIGILVIVAIILISNTITVSANARSKECEVMRLIGAPNYMIRAPFVLEGILIGIIGTALSLGIIMYLYNYLTTNVIADYNIVLGIFVPVDVMLIMPVIAKITLLSSIGLSFVVSYLTIWRHLKV